MQKYENVRLYPEVVPPVLEELINRSAAYLDINYGTADQATLALMRNRETDLVLPRNQT